MCFVSETGLWVSKLEVRENQFCDLRPTLRLQQRMNDNSVGGPVVTAVPVVSTRVRNDDDVW